MGKRELVLAVIFVALGVCVYQFTAPPPPPGSDTSIGGIFRNVRRHIEGPRETMPANWTTTVPVDPSTSEVRINVARPNELTVTGEDRDDIAVEEHGLARGYDQTEAKAAADSAILKVETAGNAIVLTTDPVRLRATPRNARLEELTIAIRVPQRLAVRLEPHFGRFTATNLASAEITASRGDTRITHIFGALQITHSGGMLEIGGVQSLKLSGRNSHGTVKAVAGPVSLDVNGGELELSDITGPVDGELRNTELTIDADKVLKPVLRLNANGGRVRVDGLRTETRIDGRHTDIEITMAAAAPITIDNTGQDITLIAPPGGYALDAVATDGRLDLEDGELKPEGENDPRVSGKVRGGGPMIMLRTTHGDITVRKPAGK